MDMPKPPLPCLQRHTTRHGKVAWYVRVNRGPLIRIRGVYGSDEFMAQYEAAVAGAPLVKPGASLSGSLRWLWERYRESAAWEALSPATRRQRENIMLHVLEAGGHQPFKAFKRKNIEESVDARRKTPSQARNFLDCMKGVFRWAKKNEHVTVDPTDGVDNPQKKKTKGFPAWTEEDVTAYQARWPVGTAQRVWLDMILYTGPRRGDVFRLGKQHRRTVIDQQSGAESRMIVWHTEKGGELLEVAIPILPVLQETLDAGPTGDLAFIVNAYGRPFKSKEAFGNAFSAAARKAGVKKSAHGVRKIAATTAADNGATEHQLMAIFGWINLSTAQIYTRDANRRRLAKTAAHTLSRTGEQQIQLLPSHLVRAPGKKAQ